jgi:hypothetical protein
MHCRVFPPGGSANSDADPQKIWANVFNCGTDPVLTAMPAALFDTNSVEGQVDVVVNNDDVIWFNLEKFCKLTDWLARVVHERKQGCCNHFVGSGPEPPLGNNGYRLVTLHWRTEFGG